MKYVAFFRFISHYLLFSCEILMLLVALRLYLVVHHPS